MEAQKYTIATLGSHSALQILHGAHLEGFNTLIVTTPQKASLYRRYGFINEILEIPSFSDFGKIENDLKKRNVILVPHGSFVAYLGASKNKNMTVSYFGNKNILDWEENRDKQHKWLTSAGILLPKVYKSIEEAQFPVIVKLYGAAGGEGYFLATSREDFEKKRQNIKTAFIIQQYIVGVPLYIHYFQSPLTGKLEILSMDRRYETNVDAVGRIPAKNQIDLGIDPSYVVVGNSPLVIRESLLEECFRMGEKVIKASQKIIDKRGLFGPFCLETIITPDQKIYTIEISGRIVAGTNLYTSGSPYADLLYDEPMSSGRRIAREIKTAIEQNKLDQILD